MEKDTRSQTPVLAALKTASAHMNPSQTLGPPTVHLFII